jgi:hypothetical protein
MKKILALVLLLAASSAVLKHQGAFAARQDRADANPWQDIAPTQFNRLAGGRSIRPAKSRGLQLNRAALAEQLKQAPLERTPEADARPLLLPLPYPDGTFKTFRVVESPVMEPGLAEKFPDIRTYFADSPEDPAARVRFDLTPQGFHAMILSDKPTILIDPPIQDNPEYYLSYYKRDLPQTDEAWHCDVKQDPASSLLSSRVLLPPFTTIRNCALTGSRWPQQENSPPRMAERSPARSAPSPQSSTASMPCMSATLLCAWRWWPTTSNSSTPTPRLIHTQAICWAKTKPISTM